jgi:hypothetical protein
MRKSRGDDYMIIDTIKKYLPIIFLLLILFLLPIDWYKQLHGNTSTYKLENVNGMFVFTKFYGIIVIIYGFCIYIQLFSIIYKKFLLPILAEFILIVALILLPTFIYPFKYTGFSFLLRLYVGFYFALAFIICCIVLNIIYFFRNRK